MLPVVTTPKKTLVLLLGFLVLSDSKREHKKQKLHDENGFFILPMESEPS